MKYLILLLLISCNENSRESSTTESKFCVEVSSSMDRCENNEVVCYKYHSYKRGGLSCKWKDK